jgi:hypothetical protein
MGSRKEKNVSNEKILPNTFFQTDCHLKKFFAVPAQTYCHMPYKIAAYDTICSSISDQVIDTQNDIPRHGYCYAM